VTLITAVLSAAGTLGYFAVLNSDGFVGIFEWMTLPLFGLLFAWIAFSFLLATIGFVALSKERSWRLRWRLKLKSFDGDDAPDPVEVPVESGSTTAILMPIYNESPDRVFAGIRAMVRSLEAEQLEDEFELYVLSDTTQSEVWLREELAWSQLKEELEGNVQVHYRHRPRNKSRKAGNIADFVTRWGHRHEYMIVLDADSLVSAKTMRTMVSRMNADAYLGILQVPPTPIGRDSVFARLQQFSASVYGPVFVKGFSIWAGDEANYWGHNAIIRVAPFRQHCELPLLPGSAPLGGEILSHDFVEAALMLRSGWKVQVATDIGGSYEECPTTLADYAQRDQRWCQGNLQHSKLLVAENYRPLSRFHFACGVMSYIASPLWMLFTVLCVLATIRNVAAGDESVGANPAGAVVIFGVTMTLLLLPKLWCLLLLTMSRQSVHRYGGDLRLWTSAAIEVIASVLLSPIMAIFHTRFVLGTLLGKNVRWNAQQRDERGVSWSEAASQFAWPSFIACLLTSIMAWSAPGLLLWFSPLLAGVIVSIPLAVLLGSTRVGNWLKRHYLLATPEELRQPEIVQLHREAVAAIEPHGVSQPLFKQFVRDPALFHLHRAIQRTTDADVELPRPRQEQIAAVVGESHVADIPEDCRFDILCNADLHQDLHVEQQV
jgi:membrane glycosyltransferase